ncbi:MAG: hypothetical protein VX752_05460 [Actinomycetota bacterium]|jgi:hypothetical protein|nr:hypothetical protein [Actinomycetota bacterium]
MRDTEGMSWWMFVACALFFTAGSIRAGDPLFIIGSLLFLAACVLFLIGRGRPNRR